MEKEQFEQDWISGPLASDGQYHRVQFVSAELRDFGRDVGVTIIDEAGKTYSPAMSRYWAQKLFDELWRFHFRPSEKPDAK